MLLGQTGCSYQKYWDRGVSDCCHTCGRTLHCDMSAVPLALHDETSPTVNTIATSASLVSISITCQHQHRLSASASLVSISITCQHHLTQLKSKLNRRSHASNCKAHQVVLGLPYLF